MELWMRPTTACKRTGNWYYVECLAMEETLENFALLIGCWFKGQASKICIQNISIWQEHRNIFMYQNHVNRARKNIIIIYIFI